MHCSMRCRLVVGLDLQDVTLAVVDDAGEAVEPGEARTSARTVPLPVTVVTIPSLGSTSCDEPAR